MAFISTLILLGLVFTFGPSGSISGVPLHDLGFVLLAQGAAGVALMVTVRHLRGLSQRHTQGLFHDLRL
jgi:hypothetical protein